MYIIHTYIYTYKHISKHPRLTFQGSGLKPPHQLWPGAPLGHYSACWALNEVNAGAAKQRSQPCSRPLDWGFTLWLFNIYPVTLAFWVG